MRIVRTILLSISLLFAIPGIAWAAMAVIDMGAIVKLTDQLTKLQEQIKILGDVRKGIQDQIDAVGKMGQITLPIINSVKMASQINQDMQCLKPDFEKLMPNVSFEDLNWDSVCDGTNAYEQTLLLDPEKVIEIKTWDKRQTYLKEVNQRRENVLKDAALKGLSLADRASKSSEDQNKATDEIEAAADAAQDERSQLAVLLRILALLSRGQAKQQQVEAQQLKVMSAIALKIGVPAEQLEGLGKADK